MTALLKYPGAKWSLNECPEVDREATRNEETYVGGAI